MLINRNYCRNLVDSLKYCSGSAVCGRRAISTVNSWIIDSCHTSWSSWSSWSPLPVYNYNQFIKRKDFDWNRNCNAHVLYIPNIIFPLGWEVGVSFFHFSPKLWWFTYTYHSNKCSWVNFQSIDYSASFNF